jgi:membrane fusion protein (multidrug efflux system)
MGDIARIQQLETAAAIASGPGPQPGRQRAVKRVALALALLVGTAAVGDFGYDYWTTGRFLESTDDAYVQADYTTIAPKVSGYLATVLVDDNAQVKAGQVLARIDDRDFRAALDQARANVAAADAAVGNLDAQISLQQAEIEQAAAVVASTRASLRFAQTDAERYRELVGSGAGTLQHAQQTQAARDQLTAQSQRDEAALIATQRKVAVLHAARDQAMAEADRSRAMLHQAELNLSYTTITAPMDGTVGARTLRVGQYVAAGTQLMAVVPLNAAYVVANFKETQLAHVRAGQPVRVTVDGVSGVTLAGHVDSLSPASGLEFALLPPDNATGNFTKIVQRIPVKIVLDDAASGGVLRAGMSVEPTIDTKPTAPRLAAASSSQPG